MISIQTLLMALNYDPDTGIFHWKARSDRSPQWNGRFAGARAFISQRHGYMVAEINNRPVSAHRAAMAMTTGAWPDGEVDHINGDRADNRLENLRCVDRATNAKNQKKSVANSSGVTGVHFYNQTQKWQAKICVDRRQHHLGFFDKFEDAVAVRKIAEIKHGFHQNHGRDLP